MKALITCILFLVTISLFGQDTTITIPKETYLQLLESNIIIPADAKKQLEPIATDRPHQTETAQIVPAGYFQIESGFGVEREYATIATRQVNIGYNHLLVKYGLGHDLDLRIGTSFVNTRIFSQDSLAGNLYGLTGFMAGGKKLLYRSTGWRPTATLMTEIFLPYIGHSAYRPPFTGGTIRLLFENEITEHLELEYNFGPHWTGYSANASYFYAVSLTYNLWKGLSIYGESYGFFVENFRNRFQDSRALIPDIRIDGGFVYLINNNLQLDIEAGIGLSEISPDGFVALGFAWRFSK